MRQRCFVIADTHFGHMGKAAAFEIDLGDGLVVVAGPIVDCYRLLKHSGPLEKDGDDD